MRYYLTPLVAAGAITK
jgi:hypothetical protein